VQTRKSSKIKKWLLLSCRLLLSLSIAFAQPYFAAKTKKMQQMKCILFDNSFSMQAKGKQGGY
jgi:hypothetical protein